MRTAYAGGKGRGRASYLCDRTSQLQATSRLCQQVGGVRLDRAIAAAFLEVVTPAGVEATARAIGELEAQHHERVRQRALAVERSEYEAGLARRRYEACEPENRLVARGLERSLEEALAAVEREGRALRGVERARPAPLTDEERRSLGRLARELPRIWQAPTTSDRERKELLRALVVEVVLVVDRERARASLEVFWEGGVRTELEVALNATSPKRTDTSLDLVELVRRLAAEHDDQQIAGILARQGRLTATGLRPTAARVAGIRERAGIPTAPPPDPHSDRVSILGAAEQLGVSTQTIRRWLAEGLLAGEQATPHAPFRIRLDDQVRRRFVPEVPAGFHTLAEAARRLGLARQTVLNQVRRGERRAVQVNRGRRRGLRIEVGPDDGVLFG
jgi:transposase